MLRFVHLNQTLVCPLFVVHQKGGVHFRDNKPGEAFNFPTWNIFKFFHMWVWLRTKRQLASANGGSAILSKHLQLWCQLRGLEYASSPNSSNWSSSLGWPKHAWSIIRLTILACRGHDVETLCAWERSVLRTVYIHADGTLVSHVRAACESTFLQEHLEAVQRCISICQCMNSLRWQDPSSLLDSWKLRIWGWISQRSQIETLHVHVHQITKTLQLYARLIFWIASMFLLYLSAPLVSYQLSYS